MVGIAGVEACWLHGFYVLPGWWGTGVADDLHGAALDAMPDCPELRLWVLEENHRARRFYEKRGWRLNGETRVVPFPPSPLDVGYSYVREESVRRRRRVPALELLDATLPELRHGLTERAARSVAYELFEKLGYGAVAVTDRHEVLAFVGAGADHHGAGDRPIRPGVRGDSRVTRRCSRRSASEPSATTRRARSARPRLCRSALHDGPVGAIVAYAHGRFAARRGSCGDARADRPPPVDAAPAVRASHCDDDRAAGADGAALRLQRAQHDRVVHPHRAGTSAPARARVRRSSAQSASRGRASSSRSKRSCDTCRATSSSSRHASARSSA